MKQMKIDPAYKVDIDFTAPGTKASLKTLQPVVFKEGNAFCCLLGEDPTVGIFGCGDTAFEAINDWEISLQKRIDHHEENDELANYVIDSLKQYKK